MRHWPANRSNCLERSAVCLGWDQTGYYAISLLRRTTYLGSGNPPPPGGRGSGSYPCPFSFACLFYICNIAYIYIYFHFSLFYPLSTHPFPWYNNLKLNPQPRGKKRTGLHNSLSTHGRLFHNRRCYCYCFNDNRI